jgi:phage baseplate assembly protein W
MATPTKADTYTIKTNQIEYYADFMSNFDKNPVTGFLARVTNVDSIMQSLKSLVLTLKGERPFQPWLGSKTFALLFEPNDVTVAYALQQEIASTIKNCEPRVTLQSVVVQNQSNGVQPDDNSIVVTINFSINAIPNESFTLDVILNRIR